MSDDIKVDKELVGQLIDGTIDDSNATRLLKMAHKDKDRFFKYIDALQERVSWPEKILLYLLDGKVVPAVPLFLFPSPAHAGPGDQYPHNKSRA